jgi:F420-0:gamma-glutamyl ligase
MTAAAGLQILPVAGLPEIRPGDVLAELIAAAASVLDGDVVVVTSKIVSKAEGRLVDVAPDDPTARLRLADVVADRVEQVGFPQPNAAVDEQRVVGAGRRLGDRESRRVRETVRGPDDVGLERVAGVD